MTASPASAPPTIPTREVGDRYDVVVVGARIAGAATAMLLARAGLSVLVAERSRPGADTLSTHALTKPGVLQLSRWGLLEQIRRAGTPRVDTVHYTYGEEELAFQVKPSGDVDGLYAPRRTLLDRVLVDAAVDAGATVVHRTAVTDLITGPDDRVRGVVLRGPSGPIKVRAQLVIGADGARSFVARRTGAPVEHRAAASTASTYTYVEGLPDHAYRNIFKPGVTAGVIPTNDGLANVWVSVDMGRFRREGAGDIPGFFHDNLTAADPALAAHVAAQPGVRLHTFPGRLGFTRRPWGPGWALVGDAAYFKDPLSAHGMTDALIGAELLARAVIERFSGVGESEALAGYARERAALAAPMVEPLSRLTAFAWPPSEVQTAHLGLNQAMRAEWMALSALGPLPMVPRPVVGVRP